MLLLRGWCHIDAANGVALDQLRDHARCLQLLDECTCVCEAWPAPVGHRDRMLDAKQPLIEDAVSAKLVAKLQQPFAVAGEEIRFAGLEGIDRAFEIVGKTHELRLLERPRKKQV